MNIYFKIPIPGKKSVSMDALQHTFAARNEVFDRVLSCEGQLHYIPKHIMSLLTQYGISWSSFLLTKCHYFYTSYPVNMLDNPGVSRRIYTNEPPLHLE